MMISDVRECASAASARSMRVRAIKAVMRSLSSMPGIYPANGVRQKRAVP
jgi:hypothetical protein